MVFLLFFLFFGFDLFFFSISKFFFWFGFLFCLFTFIYHSFDLLDFPCVRSLASFFSDMLLSLMMMRAGGEGVPFFLFIVFVPA